MAQPQAEHREGLRSDWFRAQSRVVTSFLRDASGGDLTTDWVAGSGAAEVAAGDLLVFFVFALNEGGAAVITPPAGLATVADTYNSGRWTDVRYAVYTKVAGASEPNVTFSVDVSVDWCLHVVAVPNGTSANLQPISSYDDYGSHPALDSALIQRSDAPAGDEFVALFAYFLGGGSGSMALWEDQPSSVWGGDAGRFWSVSTTPYGVHGVEVEGGAWYAGYDASYSVRPGGTFGNVQAVLLPVLVAVDAPPADSDVANVSVTTAANPTNDHSLANVSTTVAANPTNDHSLANVSTTVAANPTDAHSLSNLSVTVAYTPQGGPSREPEWSAAFTVGAEAVASSTHVNREPVWSVSFLALADMEKAVALPAAWPTVFSFDAPVSKHVVREPDWVLESGFFTATIQARFDLSSAPVFGVVFSASAVLEKAGGEISPLTRRSYLVTTRQFPGVRRR